jgi:hypothetical protein
MDGKRGHAVACVPILFFFSNLAANSYGGGPFSPWASHAIPMGIATYLALRPRAEPVRPVTA